MNMCEFPYTYIFLIFFIFKSREIPHTAMHTLNTNSPEESSSTTQEEGSGHHLAEPIGSYGIQWLLSLTILHTVGSKSNQPPWCLPLTAIVNKSYNIECCVYKSNISNHPKYDFFKI